MDVLVVVLLLMLLVLILTLKSSFNKNIEVMTREIMLLRNELLKRNQQDALAKKNLEAPQHTPVVPPAPVKQEVPKEKDYWESSFTPVANPGIEPTPKQNKVTSTEDPIVAAVIIPEKAKSLPAETSASPEKSYQAPPPAQGFFERHPDLEKFIGENLINKIGIAILVLAIGFFVKYAIDNNWVAPVGRVGIGILCGGILIAFAHRLRTNYKAFSSVLAGGGLAIFYFTIALAYHQFHLFSQLTSFIIMIVITGFAVLLSILYDRQELAIIALVGGFAAPFMVSNGNGDYQTLFIYLLVLNTGLLIIAYNKAWRLLNLLSFIFTIVLFAAWIMQLPDNPILVTYKKGLAFGTAFYLLFFIINIANNIRENKRFLASDFGILLLNTSLYFSAGLYFISAMHSDNYRGLFSASMGVFNLAASYFLFRKQQVDKNILYLLIGITLTFVSLTAPLQLHGNYITLFWASETVLLYWLYQRSSIGIIRYSSCIVWVAMLVSLLMDWLNIYSNSHTLAIILNKGFVTGIYAAMASYCLSFLVKKDIGTIQTNNFLPAISLARLTAVAAWILFFTTGILEINYQFLYYYPGTNLHIQYILLYVYVFILLLSLLARKVIRLNISWQPSALLIAASLFLYLLFIQNSFSLLLHLVREKKYVQHFNAHWLGDIVLAALFVMLIKSVRQYIIPSKNTDFIAWVLCAWIVIFLSSELYLISDRLFFTDGADWERIGTIFIKTALPIIWGLCSFAFMWLGMKHKFRPLRIISLVLFSITLIKLFAFDITNIPAGGKIAAFFCLGVLLLVVSFMYQRLKHIITEDEKKTEA